jgi:D-alanine-D-alanine ligase-like ATP-grasp enzyme
MMQAQATKPEKLRGISDIRRYFYRNETPTLFVSATNFNLIGIDEWVRRFRYINYIDCFDGQHPNVFVPPEVLHRPFTSIEDINNYLLEHKSVVDYIASQRTQGTRPRAVFLFFDERTEQICEELGIDVWFPRAELRRAVDNKLETTRIGNRAGIESVPNVLAKVASWEDLTRVSQSLGNSLVIQTAFGDSGHTTFFVASKEEFQRHQSEIIEAPEVKVMKRVRCRGSAMEACVTRHGTVCGPLMTELVGFPELTPYKGGWCGNEVLAESFSQAVRDQARSMTVRFGEELRKLGYRGYFEIDFLRDLDTDQLYLGEVNPRITGASAMTNLAAFAQADMPLFLFHLLEWSEVDFELDIGAINERWANPAFIDAWGQLIMKYTDDELRLVTHAPPSGVYRMQQDGSVRFVRVQTHRRTVESEDEAFFLRISKVGDYFYQGADLGILITPGRLMTPDFELNDRARRWTAGIRAAYTSVPAQPAPPDHTARIASSGSFKIL